MRNCLKILLTVLVICFSHAALAYSSPYFEGNTISPALLDEPFKPESAERKAEIKLIVDLQNKLTAEEMGLASVEYTVTPEKILQAAAPELTKEEYPHLYKLLDRSQETAWEAKDAIKDYWKCQRPYEVSKKVKLFTKPSSNASYPSGHATRGYTMAHILGLLVPEKRTEFLLVVHQMTERRVLVGEHFPSDLKAGRRLAFIVIGGLLQNSEFKKDFAAAKKELAAYQPNS